MKSGFFLVILALLPWSSLFAQTPPKACLQGHSDNLELALAVQRFSSPQKTLLGNFGKQTDRFWRNLGQSPLPFLEDAHANHQNCLLSNDSMSDYQKILHAIRIPTIATKCIVASVQRRIPGGNNYCSQDSGSPKRYANAQVGQCITNEVVNYYQWAIQQAYACLAYESAGPLDMKLIFKIFNNESGFSPFQRSGAGLGIGQLTTPAVADMATETSPGILDKVLKSGRKECQPFQAALKESRPSEISQSMVCHFQNPNNGIARQLIYSMGYLLRIRDGLMNIPEKLKATGIEDIRFANLILAVKYSAEASKAPMLLQHLLNKPKQSFEQFNAYVEEQTRYADDMKEKMEELKQIDPSIKSAADCIQY